MPNTNIRLRYRNQLFVDLPVPKRPTQHRFFVLFHGLVSLVEGPNDEFRAYALNMDDEHRYRLGHWLVEDELPSGLRGQLLGVKASPKSQENSLNPELNATIRVKTFPDDNDPRIRARITLPRPRQIHYLGLGDATFKRPELLIYPTTTACGLKVFEYELPGSLDELSIRADDGAQTYWQAKTFTEFPGARVKLSTLHLIDSPPHPTGVAHSLDEFALSTSLLGKPKVELLRKPVDRAEQPPPPDGLSLFEVDTPAARAAFLHRIATFARTARFTDSKPLTDDSCKSCCNAADGDGS